jgi:hypothetical protein
MSTGWIVKAQYAAVAIALFAGEVALAKTPMHVGARQTPKGASKSYLCR